MYQNDASLPKGRGLNELFLLVLIQLAENSTL